MSSFSLRDEQVEQVVDLAQRRADLGLVVLGDARAARRPGSAALTSSRWIGLLALAAAPGRPGRCSSSGRRGRSLRSASSLLTFWRAREQRLDLARRARRRSRESREMPSKLASISGAAAVHRVGDASQRLLRAGRCRSARWCRSARRRRRRCRTPTRCARPGSASSSSSWPVPAGVSSRYFSPSRLSTSIDARLSSPNSTPWSTSKFTTHVVVRRARPPDPADPDAGDLDHVALVQAARVAELGAGTTRRRSRGTSAG